MPIEHQRSRVDAVAQAGRFGTVFEDMAEMCITATAQDFSALQPMPGILFLRDAVRLIRLPEAGPAAAGIVFHHRIEQNIAAAHATIQAAVMTIPIGTRKRRFGATLTAYLILLRGKFFAPGRFGFY